MVVCVKAYFIRISFPNISPFWHHAKSFVRTLWTFQSFSFFILLRQWNCPSSPFWGLTNQTFQLWSDLNRLDNWIVTLESIKLTDYDEDIFPWRIHQANFYPTSSHICYFELFFWFFCFRTNDFKHVYAFIWWGDFVQHVLLVGVFNVF